MKRTLWVGLLALGLAGPANATLVSRLGGLAYYDNVLDIMWLTDANAGAGSTFDNGFSTTDGRMTWASAKAWAASLAVAGFTDWRLPTMVDTSSPGCDFAYTGTDCGYNVQTTSGSTVYSEMASLFYDTLGNLAYADTSGSRPQSGWGLTNTGPFTNLQADSYWSGLEYAPNPDGAWTFLFGDGTQYADRKGYEHFAWAVRSGDVGVPEPGTAVLLGAALGLLGWGRRARRVC